MQLDPYCVNGSGLHADTALPFTSKPIHYILPVKGAKDAPDSKIFETQVVDDASDNASR